MIWGKRLRRLLGAAAPEFDAVKPKWVHNPKGVPKIHCKSCGWAKGSGHDRWCEYVKK